MRILLNAMQSENRSGTGRYVTELARALHALAPKEELQYLCPDGKIRCFEEAFLQKPVTPLPLCKRVLTEQWKLPGLVRKKHFDLLHYPAGTGLLFASAPHVLTIHDLCYLKNPDWFPKSRARYYSFVMGKNVRHASRIFADSQATARDAEALLSVPSEKIDVIPLGISPDFSPAGPEARKQLRQCLLLPERFFLFVGTLEPRKNLTTLVRAWARLPEYLPELVLAGRPGWKITQDALRNASGAQAHRLHFLNYVPAELLPALYSEATVFVYPSLMEGFGLPPLEAMACGTPVVTSNTSSLPEVTGDAAVLISPEDETELAGALEWVAGDETLCSRMREKGLSQSARFTWEKTAQLTLAGYRKILGGY
ncbi:MAG TPA: glycosyltransferase family 1 protein [Candidatus Hydrogenedentes bacterium]|jgi:glycosyltransferase involved in cell wall biosynthesis|nr:glycosyltransferase family 1 protein [Candidatus Hydrogenedentota bacterium]HQB02554.1 glycosyltransferase family 1 protein [Candidatus Hydrogenedentota bacterium]